MTSARGSESGFHNAAGSAEDNASAGAESPRGLSNLFVGQVLEIDARRSRSVGPSSLVVSDYVDIRVRRRRPDRRGLDLEFLRGAGHDADDDDILRVDARLSRRTRS